MAFLQDIASPTRVQMLDLPYGTGCTLDAYVNAPPGSHPTVITVALSAWCYSDRRDGAGAFHQNVIKKCLDAGLNVVNVSVRCSQVAPFPACLVDVLTAIRWVKRNWAGVFAIPDRLGLWGGSAAGHVVALSQLVAGGVLDPGGDPADARVKAVGSACAPYDLDLWDDDVLWINQPLPAGTGPTGLSYVGEESPNSPLGVLLGCDPSSGANWGLVRQASPGAYRLDLAATPKHLVTAGQFDVKVPVAQAYRFAVPASQSAHSPTFKLYNAGHSDGVLLTTGAQDIANWFAVNL